MVAITIRHVPEGVRDKLAARAARNGQSLQEYLAGELTRLAEKPAVTELLAEVRGRREQAGTVLDRETILADRDAERP